MNNLNIPTLIHIQSSNIAGVSYDKENKELFVLFGSNKLYVYKDVEQVRYITFMGSESKGKYLYGSIKKNYQCEFVLTTVKKVVIDHKKHKIVLIDNDFDRDYVIVDGEKQELFDTTPKADDEAKV